MDKKELRIVYMGTPDFAVESLRRLVEDGFNVVGVVTMPDKPIGRHQNELQPSPVKRFAVSKGIPVLQPEKLKSEDFVHQLKSLDADLQIVVAFRMLPEVVWNMPRLGTFNLHASLLPQYRGAAPINWAIINGETETGITTFFLDHEIDTGKIIQRVRVPILEDDNAETLHDKLMMLGGDLVVETVNNILSNQVVPIPQSEMECNEPLRHAPKIFKDTCKVNWKQGVKRCYDFIRGLSPYPAAWTELLVNDKAYQLKIYQASKELCQPSENLGTVVTDHRKILKIALSDGYLVLDSLQISGKKRMNAADFLRGFRFEGECYVK